MQHVPVGYLLPAVLVLWSVYTIAAPLSWVRPLRFWWVLGAVLNELPLLAMVMLGAATVLAVYEGDIFSSAGWIAFGLNIVAILSLLILYIRSLRAAPMLTNAFREGLGDRWSDRQDQALARVLRQHVFPRSLLGPLAIRRRGVQHLRSIPYGTAGRAHTLDLYRVRSALSAPRKPIFIHLHGGALRSGRKDHDALPVLYYLAHHG